jgi:flagellar hook assembly protein FlgD
VTIDVYNSAGEEVASLYDGPSAYSLTQLKVTISGPQPSGAPVLVDMGGLGIPGGDPVWNGSNQGGQWVTNGVYYIKVSSTDPFGNVTTITHSVNVVGVENQESVEVFNSAGEVVRKFDLSGITPTVQSISLNLPSGQGVVAASVNPSTGATSGGTQLTLILSNGGTQTLYWDGMGSNGAPLQSGTYLVELVRTEPGASTTIKTLSVALLQPKNSTALEVAASAKIGPNPVLKGGPVTVRFNPAAGIWVRARLYNENGELVAQCVDMGGSNTLTLGGGYSGGIYVLDFEVCEGDIVVARRMIKAAVVH